MYIESVIHQLRLAVDSVFQMIHQLSNDDLNFRPVENKKSIGELVQHICELIEADLLISKGASKEDMIRHYESVQCNSLDDLKNLLQKGLSQVELVYLHMNKEDLQERGTSYWGVEYTRFEWLLEILVHFTHHRAQLHMLMVQKYKHINVSLFE